jgi:hypothetical protein
MGAGTLLAAATCDPVYFTKHLKGFVGLAPATRCLYSHILLKLAVYVKFFEALELLSINEILNGKEFPHEVVVALCKVFPNGCNIIMKLLSEKQPEYNNIKKFLVFSDYFPAGTSNHIMKQLTQQSVHDGYYEYQKNETQPLVEYNFKKFPRSIPVGILFGKADLLVDVKDAEWLKGELGNAVKMYKQYEGYGHLTFLIPGKYYGAYQDGFKFINSRK